VARNFGLYAAALALLPLAGVRPWLLVLATPLMGLAMYRLTIVMHDCLHGTLFASRRANRFVGIAAGALAAVEFHAFARLHWRHHASLGRPDDPQGPDYWVPEEASRGALLWHLLRPLFGWNLFKLGQVLVAGERDWPGFALVGAAQLAAATVASGFWRWWWLAPVPALSAATFGLFFCAGARPCRTCRDAGHQPSRSRPLARAATVRPDLSLRPQFQPALRAPSPPGGTERASAGTAAAPRRRAERRYAGDDRAAARRRSVAQRAGGSLIRPLPRNSRVSMRPPLRTG
jgi:fatty acid desaturase